jgi:hypothetical protein
VQNLRVSSAMATAALYGWHHDLTVARSVRLALLNVPVGTAFFTSDGDLITTTTPQDWISGTRVRIEFVGSGTPQTIAPLETGTDYWLIRVGATTFRLADLFEEALSSSIRSIPTIAAGYQLRVQKPREWDGAELARWEVSHAAYPARFSLKPQSLLLPPIQNSGVLNLEILRESIENTTGIPLTYNTIALWETSNSTPGNTAGTGFSVTLLENTIGANTVVAPVTIDAQRSRRITYSLTQAFDS